MPSIASSRDLGSFIRAERGARGLTQADLAAAAGVSRQWLIEVERGHDRAELGHVLRVMSALGLEFAPVVVPSRRQGGTWYPVRLVAELIRDELERGDTDFALRMLAACLGEFDDLVDADARRAHMVEPPSTGDHRWDALIAAAVRWRCGQLGYEPPEWTGGSALDEDWWPVYDPVLEARTRQRTPFELADRRIWLDPRALAVL